MIFDVRDERMQRQIQARRTPPLLLPPVPLALVDIAVLRARDELLDRPLVVGVIGFAASSQRDSGAVVVVVVPECVEAKAAARRVAHEARILGLVFGDDVGTPAA